MGLITELICKNSYRGIKLPENIIFIGACNPYRKAEIKKQKVGLNINLAHHEKNNLNDKQREKIQKNSMDSKNKLVYTVNPLPHSLLNFVFDFGNLSEDNEQKYIEYIIDEPFDIICKKSNIKDSNIIKKIKNLAKNMIYTSQNFIRKN